MTVEVKRDIVLPQSPDDVWAALTEADRLEEWFANEVELDPEPGGVGTFRWDDGDVRHAVVEEVVPFERFAFRWDESRVVIELEEIPSGTRVTVVESPGGGWTSALELRASSSLHDGLRHKRRRESSSFALARV
jgi:uncharacterized protein YndB with AHSA1/START domain